MFFEGSFEPDRIAIRCGINSHVEMMTSLVVGVYINLEVIFGCVIYEVDVLILYQKMTFWNPADKDSACVNVINGKLK